MSGGGAFKLNAAGRTDAATIAAGLVGERKTSTVTSGSAVALTSGLVSNVTSVTLEPGDWEIVGSVGFKVDATSSLTSEGGGITAVSGGAIGTNGNTTQHPAHVPGTGNDVVMTTTTRYVRPTVTTTYYLVARAVFSGTVGAYGTMGATRQASA